MRTLELYYSMIRFLTFRLSPSARDMFSVCYKNGPGAFFKKANTGTPWRHHPTIFMFGQRNNQNTLKARLDNA